MRKSSLKILPFVAILLWFGLVLQSASGLPKLSVATVRGFPGNTVDVPVLLNYGSNDLQNVVALQADIVFDQSGLGSGTPTPGGSLRNHALATSLPGVGVRRVLVYSPNNAALSNGVVASLPFTLAAGQARNFNLILENVILAYADGTQAPATVTSGGIAVTPVYVQADGSADFYLSVLADQPFSIQASTNLSDWVELTNVVTTGSLFIHIDTEARRYPYRFYRAIPATAFPGLSLPGSNPDPVLPARLLPWK